MLKSIKSYTIHKLVDIRHTVTDLVLVEVSRDIEVQSILFVNVCNIR